MPSLDEWKSEIERLTGGLVQVIPVTTDKVQNTLGIPDAFPGRNIVRKLFLQESFVVQFIRAYSLTVNYSGVDGNFHFVLLNLAMAEKWQDKRDLLIAHEYGHLWLNAIGYRSPVYETCLSTHSGDIVQHILIRQDMKRRGFDLSFWIRNLEDWLLRLEKPATALAPCDRLQLLSQWMDAALGVTESDWPPLPKLLARAGEVYPELAAQAGDLVGFLRGRDLWDRSMYEASLTRVTEVLRAVMG